MWALRGVSLEIERGEVVGVIGHNGAGKSTLLKILSRITEPTEGYAEIRGRVGSLLEVGTGFHPELTGRENIYLNGTILGLRRAEIERKYDEIVAFAEVERFLDTPAKHYSTGMYLRLAFAVAAHLEPEILLVDEVLAVGDLAFQKKCLGKMEDVAAHGRTVLFVSHNMGAVKNLCQTSLVLKDGRMQFRGPVLEGLACYSHDVTQHGTGADVGSTQWRFGSVNGKRDALAGAVHREEAIHVEGWLDLADTFTHGRLFCIITDCMGNLVVHQRIDAKRVCGDLEPGRYRVRVEFPPLWLAPGMYTVRFKFIGQTLAGTQERQLSEPMILDVTGEIDGIDQALLAPDARWRVAVESLLAEAVS